MPIPKRKAAESQKDFMSRCIPMLTPYHKQSEAIAICYDAFKGSAVELESYNDYPEGAVNNAKRAVEWKEKNGSNCGTRIGWTRAGQLARREKISRDTIARMASFKRHQQHKDVPYSEGCGKIVYDCWGGSAGVNWAISKLKELDKK